MTTRLTTRGLTMTIVGFIAAPAFAAGFAFGGGAPVQAATATHPVPSWMTRLCDVEDQTGCYWDATTEGNQVGKSFYAKKFGKGKKRLVCVFYLDSAYAKKHDFCDRD